MSERLFLGFLVVVWAVDVITGYAFYSSEMSR
jgi:hypothetical protein